MGIIENEICVQSNYILEIDESTFTLHNVMLSKSYTPVNRPTTRGGVYFSDKFEFKLKGQVNNLSIIPLLSKSMLGPNTEFKELKITSKIQLDNSINQVTFFANLTNSLQSSSNVELSLTIVRLNVENLS